MQLSLHRDEMVSRRIRLDEVEDSFAVMAKGEELQSDSQRGSRRRFERGRASSRVPKWCYGCNSLPPFEPRRASSVQPSGAANTGVLDAESWLRAPRRY